ncbi:DUF1772 domain-containing protein [Arenibacter sp. M-2]|uniref:anthrone oxygenase family protein n=1 Tax=Arenibacter sp. M-2 TaxID=3053612 RepID=UPI0025702818|nr:DUF1772 domain-containing protein [Arenibacter sp. M-2]MDL5514285.1 DUF1772 domain-containing protein [Arenibacter sp. M-2]|tara:strand:- start:30853 stop:31362 length:510 start_codon:yes stop_codon:yes gene_type:complete
MDITFETIVMGVLIVLTGLSAGLCFTWTNAITPGIGRLDDQGYLMSFQQMNRTIINPLFFLVFFGPSLLGFISLYWLKGSPATLMWLLILAMATYFLGVVLVTIFGNVPLNEMLDKVDLNTASSEELGQLRESFEIKWNRLHLIRTISSIISFLILLMAFVQTIKNSIQ